MLSAIFITSGVRGLTDPEALVPAAKRVTDGITPLLERADPRLPTDPRTLIRLNAAAQLVGGSLLATGHLTRPAAVLLAGSLVPTTIAAHPFWAEHDPAARRTQQIHFLKNLGLFGGLLLAAADTQGRPGLRWRAQHLMDETHRSMRRAVRTARREAKLARRAMG
jgi:putative oxidoreductase